ncbi:MAG: Gfo/Idh/MocA family protein [Chloroflexota bacterium]
MTDRVRCAVIGSGFAGSTFAEALSYAPAAELVAIAGGRQADALAEKYRTRAVATADVDRLIDSAEIDAVLIASPNPFHGPQTLRAAASGKHVLVEKPMALSAREGRAMVEACRKADVVLMPGHHHRFRRNGVAARLLLDRGVIGKVDLANLALIEPDQTTWLNNPAYGGYLLGSGSHAIDVLRFLVGDVARVAALTGRYRGAEVENGSQLLLEFKNGAHGIMQNSVIPRLSRPTAGSGVARFDVQLTGETGVLQVDLYGEVRSSTESGWTVPTSLPVWEGHTAFLRLEAYAEEAREFIAAIRERRAPRVTGEDGLAAVAVVEAAHRSAADRAWVSVDTILEEA